MMQVLSLKKTLHLKIIDNLLGMLNQDKNREHHLYKGSRSFQRKMGLIYKEMLKNTKDKYDNKERNATKLHELCNFHDCCSGCKNPRSTDFIIGVYGAHLLTLDMSFKQK